MKPYYVIISAFPLPRFLTCFFDQWLFSSVWVISQGKYLYKNVKLNLQFLLLDSNFFVKLCFFPKVKDVIWVLDFPFIRKQSGVANQRVARGIDKGPLPTACYVHSSERLRYCFWQHLWWIFSQSNPYRGPYNWVLRCVHGNCRSGWYLQRLPRWTWFVDRNEVPSHPLLPMCLFRSLWMRRFGNASDSEKKYWIKVNGCSHSNYTLYFELCSLSLSLSLLNSTLSWDSLKLSNFPLEKPLEISLLMFNPNKTAIPGFYHSNNSSVV